MRKRKLVSVLCLMCVITFGLVACNTPAGKPNNTTEVTSSIEAEVKTDTEGTQDAVKSVSYKYDDFFQQLPFEDIYPLEDGPILIDGEERPIKIGFAQTAFNHPWRIEMNKSIEAQVERFPNVSLVITDGNVDVVKQNSDIDDLIAQGCDAILLSPIEAGGLVNAAKKVMGAGIPLITLDRDVFFDKTLYIGQSNYEIGKALGETAAEKLNGKGNIVEITGLVGVPATNERQDGFRDALKDYPDIKIIAEGDGEYIREPAAKLMDDWLTAFPEIDAVYSHAEESAWGATLAIKRAGREGDGIMQFTVDASNGGFRSVKSGEFTADGNYTPYIGQVGVRAALYSLMGKELTGTTKFEYGTALQLPNLPTVTAENVDEWIGKGWGD